MKGQSVYRERHQVSDKIVHHTMLGHRALAIEAVGLDVNPKVAGATFAAGVAGVQVRLVFDF